MKSNRYILTLLNNKAMLGSLNKSQISEVLRHELVGRLACYANKKLYIVPVTYAYDGKYIYVRSKEGTKVKMMRKNPEVCFEVDSIDNLAHWRSVVVWGKYQELKTRQEQETGRKVLRERLLPFINSETTERHEMRAPHIVEKQQKAIVYRITVREATGRFEKPDWPAHS